MPAVLIFKSTKDKIKRLMRIKSKAKKLHTVLAVHKLYSKGAAVSCASI